LALCTTRQVNGEFSHVFCTRLIANDCLVSLASGERTYLFPLFSEPDQDALLQSGEREPNLARDFLAELRERLGGPAPTNEAQREELKPKDVLFYAYALFYSPTYRRRYAEFLTIDFPRLLFPCSADLFGDLARVGGKLVAHHLLESPEVEHHITTYDGPKEPKVGRVGWSNETIWLDATGTKGGGHATPGTSGFHGVTEAVWNFRIGSYQVCHKWLALFWR